MRNILRLDGKMTGFVGSGLGYFLVANMLRIFSLSGFGDQTYFIADYALPPLVYWAGSKTRLPRWTYVSATVIVALLVVAADAVTIVGRRFRWGPDALPQYLMAYQDLPWKIIFPLGITIFLVSMVTIIPLVMPRDAPRRIWPLLSFISILTVIDIFVGTSRYSETSSGINIITNSSRNLIENYIAVTHSQSKLVNISSPTMKSIVLQERPVQILSIAVESLGVPRRSDQKKYLFSNLLDPIAGTYEVEESQHRFVGSTFQGEVREVCGLRLSGYPKQENFRVQGRQCLPYILSHMGYETAALHGNGGRFYSRIILYPLMGIRDSRFYDQILAESQTAHPCPNTVFNGICDDEVVTQALSQFNGRPRFVHVMTLDTHLPVPSVDPTRCPTLFPKDKALCGYQILMERSLRQIGQHLHRAKIKPDMVFIYGDHNPPLSSVTARQYFKDDVVPFIILRLRHSGSNH